MSTSTEEFDIPSSSADVGLIVGAAAATAAAWLAAGSGGFLAVPLREAFVWMLLGVFVVVNLPRGERAAVRCLPAGLAVLFLFAIKRAFGAEGVANVLEVALFAAAVAMGHSGRRRSVLAAVAAAVAVFGVYRFAVTAIPTVWHLADAVGGACGTLAGRLSGEPLCVGATFGGVDFLVLMTALIVAWAGLTPTPRRNRVAWAAVAVILAQGIYLLVLSFGPTLADSLPHAPADPNPRPQYTPPPWFWADSIRQCLPWSLPLLGLALQSLVAAGMFATLRSSEETPDEAPNQQPDGSSEDIAAVNRAGAAGVVLAVLLPIVTILSFASGDLKNRTVVAVSDSMLNLNVPKHGEYGMEAAGDLGMLPKFVELLGGTFRRCDTITDDALKRADILLVACPVRRWSDAEKASVRKFVEDGGSLLVLGGPSQAMADRRSDFHDLLSEVGLRPRMDFVVPPADLWQQGLAETAHPTAAGVRGRHAPLGIIAASSIETPWSAVPIIVGKYGWSDPGSEAFWKDIYHFEPGERLGDLVLAAETRLGKGRIVLLGETNVFSNLGIGGAYPFTGRLLGYLADGAGGPGSWFRQILGIFGSAALIFLLLWRPRDKSIALITAVFLLCFCVCTALVHAKSRVIPDGTGGARQRLAYIDASHAEPFSDIPWIGEGIDGLKLALMRDGYLPLVLREFSEERLSKAGLLILIGPRKPFSSGDRAVLRRFLEEGGTVVCMAGAEDVTGIGTTLKEDYGILIADTPVLPGDPRREPDPTGNSYTPYLELDKNRYAQLLLYAGWPVKGLHSDVGTVAGGRNGEAVAVARPVGKGRLVVIGDTNFALNRNLELASGEPLFGNRANVDFWRWLFGRFADRPDWTPPETEIKKEAVEMLEDTPAKERVPEERVPEERVMEEQVKGEQTTEEEATEEEARR